MSGAASSRPLWSARFKGYKDIDQADQKAIQGILARVDFRKHTKKRVKSGGFSDFTRFIRVGRALSPVGRDVTGRGVVLGGGNGRMRA